MVHFQPEIQSRRASNRELLRELLRGSTLNPQWLLCQSPLLPCLVESNRLQPLNMLYRRNQSVFDEVIKSEIIEIVYIYNDT